MSKRRITWLLHNVAATPFIPLRMLALLLIRLGEGAEWIGWKLPGWRRYDGWE